MAISFRLQVTSFFTVISLCVILHLTSTLSEEVTDSFGIWYHDTLGTGTCKWWTAKCTLIHNLMAIIGGLCPNPETAVWHGIYKLHPVDTFGLLVKKRCLRPKFMIYWDRRARTLWCSSIGFSVTFPREVTSTVFY